MSSFSFSMSSSAKTSLFSIRCAEDFLGFRVQGLGFRRFVVFFVYVLFCLGACRSFRESPPSRRSMPCRALLSRRELSILLDDQLVSVVAKQTAFPHSADTIYLCVASFAKDPSDLSQPTSERAEEGAICMNLTSAKSLTCGKAVPLGPVGSTAGCLLHIVMCLYNSQV